MWYWSFKVNFFKYLDGYSFQIESLLKISNLDGEQLLDTILDMHSRHRKLTASWRYFISAINLSIKRLSLQPSPENEVYCVVPIMEIQLIFKTILSWPPNRSNLIKYVFLFHSRTTHVSTFFAPIRRKNWAQRMYKWVMMFLNQNIFRQQFWNTDYCRLRLKVN